MEREQHFPAAWAYKQDMLWEDEEELLDNEAQVAAEVYANLTEVEKEDLDLEQGLEKILDIVGKYELDPFETTFEVVPARIMNTIAAYNIPNRFSHWTFGREFRKMHTMYDYGMSKIYELVINSNPSRAYLLENNPTIENKFVMAHVFAHTDFFKNNFRFEPTNRNMPERAAKHAERIRGYEDQEGIDTVEQFLDAAFAVEEYVDPFHVDRPNAEEERRQWRARADEEGVKWADMKKPPEPDEDVIGFIQNHAPYLEEWQRDILGIMREEAVYFYPQRRTKIGNEGWAAYWHKRIMRQMDEEGHTTNEESEQWRALHSGVVSESVDQLNPYHLGMKIYEYIEDYHNGHLSEREANWLRDQGQNVPEPFDGPLEDSPALPKLREVMETNDDQALIRNFFDRNVAERTNLLVYEYAEDGSGDKIVKDTGWAEVRAQLLEMLDNSGTPRIVVENGDYDKANHLYLKHDFDGRELDVEYINKTLPYLYALWQRPVHLETCDEEGNKIVYRYDGETVNMIYLDADEDDDDDGDAMLSGCFPYPSI